MGDFWKKVIGIEEDDDEEDEEELEEIEEKKERKPLFGRRKEEESEEETPVKAEAPASRPASAPLSSRPAAAPASRPAAPSSSTMPQKKFTDQLRMLIIKPQGFEESPKLVDSLKAKKPVIINLEDLETDVARKIFDFLSGATYALNGKVQKIANNIFVFSPENVDVTYNEGTKKAPEPEKSIWG